MLEKGTGEARFAISYTLSKCMGKEGGAHFFPQLLDSVKIKIKTRRPLRLSII